MRRLAMSFFVAAGLAAFGSPALATNPLPGPRGQYEPMSTPAGTPGASEAVPPKAIPVPGLPGPARAKAKPRRLRGRRGSPSGTSFYVSPAGNDSNPCSLSQPCQTIAHVQSVVQAVILAGLTAPVNVYLRAGTYQQGVGLAFGPADSGVSGKPITWQSYTGEVAVISGGQPITGWSLYSGGIYRAYAGWDFRQLYVNPGLPHGVHAQRARGTYQPAGWVRTSTGYTPPDDSMEAWGNPTEVEIVSLGPWSMDRLKAASLSGGLSSTINMFSGPVTTWDYQGPYASTEVGMPFTSDVAGQVTGLRFWRSQLYGADTGTHIGHLWDAVGNLLATATFAASSITGWDDVQLIPPVSILASTTYVVSYETGPIITATYGIWPVDNAPLHATGGSLSTTPGLFPSTPSPHTYWVDLDFTYTGPPSNAIVMANPGWTNQQGILASYDVNPTPTWVENAYELMSSGYWYLDRTSGYLYYWPPSGSMAGTTVVAPVVDPLLTVSGGSYIQFGSPTNPLVFAYSNWVGPDSTTGYVGEQNGYTWVTVSTAIQTLDAALVINGSTNISFNGDQLSHLGSRVFLIEDGSSNVSIINNRFDDNAAGAVQIGTIGTCPAGCPSFVRENDVLFANNIIATGNDFDYLDTGAIFAPAMSNSTIANNEIDSIPWGPVTLGWGWGATPYCSNNTVNNNSINNPCIGPPRLGWDCGSIYSLGAHSSASTYATGLFVTGNYSQGSVDASLYLDEGTAWSTWENNNMLGSYNYWAEIGSQANNDKLLNNYTDNNVLINNGVNITIVGPIVIPGSAQAFGTGARSIVCGAGVPGASACSTPTLWSMWQNGAGATWSHPQIGP